MAPSPFDLAATAARQLLAEGAPGAPAALVVLGTGLSPTAALLGARQEAPVDLTRLAGFAPPTVAGHRKEGWWVDLEGCVTLVVGGRVHLYEGHTPHQVVHLVRTAVLAGCSTVVLTGTVGALRPQLAPGEVVVIADHLNLTGRSPLTGVRPDDPLGTPFVDLTDAWSPRLRQAVRAALPEIQEGVYAQMGGPQFETPAEITMLRAMGADLVGMSTALEAVAARHLGAEVLGLAVVTNPAAGLGEGSVSLEQIKRAVAGAPPQVARAVRAALGGRGSVAPGAGD